MTITFRSGHAYQPSGTGDFYHLHCPTHGQYPNPVLFMVAHLAGPNTRCPLCSGVFGARFQTATVTDGATATEETAGRRKVTAVVTDNAGVKDR